MYIPELNFVLENSRMLIVGEYFEVPQAFIRRFISAETGFDPRQGHLYRFFSEDFSFLCQYHSTNAPYPSSSTRRSNKKDKGVKVWEHYKKQCCFRSWGALDREAFYIFVLEDIHKQFCFLGYYPVYWSLG